MQQRIGRLSEKSENEICLAETTENSIPFAESRRSRIDQVEKDPKLRFCITAIDLKYAFGLVKLAQKNGKTLLNSDSWRIIDLDVGIMVLQSCPCRHARPR